MEEQYIRKGEGEKKTTPAHKHTGFFDLAISNKMESVRYKYSSGFCAASAMRMTESAYEKEEEDCQFRRGHNSYSLNADKNNKTPHNIDT